VHCNHRAPEGGREFAPCYNLDMEPIITSDPKVMHGTPCFAGTRVAVQTFFDRLEAGYAIDGFLEQFPTLRREQVVRLLEQRREDAPTVP
jgi:uncharacterized protein (DUF433 family)